mgnify:CR=1 FL=1
MAKWNKFLVKESEKPSSKLVKKLVIISQGEVTEKDLRPDIFYDEFEEKKELRKIQLQDFLEKQKQEDEFFNRQRQLNEKSESNKEKVLP